ncbi:snoaL-like domain protein [Collimonas arenae]|uniref:SnoaL-like domain protein n=1 Tax=Collimonas arenae TaxID=279058 RepID=A0A127PNI6_9BURK|nr:nuclear transport factor 2 family protein [Collimonas arenae]AMO99164.1 snoaL-like domain protein [Collimonas arenae]AMP09062.1 snoaL-like domain protein [Collimonas arenae]
MGYSTIERWHEIVKSRDTASLKALLADDVVFESPVVHTPQHGRVITAKYLAAALHVLNNGTFRYLNEWLGPHSAVLEFETTCDGILVNGVDIITWNDQGLITRFKVMIRPLKAINKIHEMMGRMLQAEVAQQR